MIQLQGVLGAAEQVQAFCLQHDWLFCFIGGIAVQRWGEPRLTQDADLTLLTVFAGRDRDWGDVESVLIRQHGKLDFALIRSELKPLLELKGEPEALHKLEGLITTIDRRLHTEP
jgi:hypothetical protein